MVTKTRNLSQTDRQKRERNPNTTLKITIKTQAKRAKEEETEKNYKNHSKTINKMARIIYLSIINLNVNELNATIKRGRVAE